MAAPRLVGHDGEVLDDIESFMMIKTTMARAISPSDTASRSSFSSVRENDDGLAQTFTRSKISSYTAQAHEDVFDETPSPSESSRAFFQPPLTQPHSKLHQFLVPADSFKGWKQIPIKGKKASRSCEDLHKLHMTWSPPASPVIQPASTNAVGSSPLERLPSEILGKFNLAIN
jgi:hypothetical protein